jgi:hypothetical protein
VTVKKDKKMYLDELNKNAFYISALASIKDENEKAKTRALAEDIFVKMTEGLMQIKKIIEEHPDEVAEVMRRGIDKDKTKDK